MPRKNHSTRLVRTLVVVAGVACAALPRASSAMPSVLQPGVVNGQDATVYQGFPASNLSGGTLTPPFSTFVSYLVVSQTSSGNDLHALVKFDLSSLVGVASQEVQSATFSLYAVDSRSLGFPTASPSATSAIDVSVHVAGDSWTQAAVTWNSKPYAVVGDNQPVGTAIDTQRVAGINRWVDFDVTAALRQALDTQQSALSLALSSPSAVVGVGGEVSLVALASESAASSAVAGLQPKLTLAYVPQPGAWLMLGLGAAMLMPRRGARPT